MKEPRYVLVALFYGFTIIVVGALSLRHMFNSAYSDNEAPHPATVWHREITCKETEMKNFCYCAGENSCSFTEKCDVAEKAGFDVIYSGKDVFK